MNLHYISNARLPSERANTLQTMWMCEAFAAAGAETTLLHPWRAQTKAMKAVKDLWAHYGVKRDAFRITRVPALDFLPAAEKSGIPGAAKAAFLLQTWTYTALAVPLVAALRPGLVFTREIYAAGAILPLRHAGGFKVIYEAHTLPNRRLFPILRQVDGVVAVSQGLVEQIREAGAKKILLAPNGVDLRRFENLPSRAEARAALGWDGRPVAAYVGQLLAWKGVDTFAAAAKHAPEVRFVAIGGSGRDLEAFRGSIASSPNAEAVGQVPPGDVPLRLRAADVLVLPNTARDKESREHTSPLKLKEYFASGTPVVASDLPSIREMANERNCRLVPPDDPLKLAEGIRSLIGHRGEAEALARRARADVDEFTWLNRAKRILEFAAS